MIFYKIEAQIINLSAEEISAIESDRPYRMILQAKMKFFHEKNKEKFLMFISSIRDNKLIAGAIIDCTAKLNEKFPEFMSTADIEYKNIQIEEVSFGAMKSLLKLSSNNAFIYQIDENAKYAGLEMLLSEHNHNFEFDDAFIQEKIKKSDLIKKAKSILCGDSLLPELDRIFQIPKKFAAGHPVHYIVQTDDETVCDEIIEVLLSALYSNNRLQNRRFNKVHPPESGRNKTAYKELYSASVKGAIVVKVEAELKEDDDMADVNAEKIESICKIALKNRNKTLTVFVLPRAAERIKSIMREHLANITLVEIGEDDVTAKKARVYLQQKAVEQKMNADKLLYKEIRDLQKVYSISELNQAYNYWYDNQLKTHCFTQYSEFESSGRIVSKKAKPKGAAHKELEKMIGLNEAKTVIKQAVDYFKAQKLFCDRGITESRPVMHMVFTGAPGTAKTTAARLFAKIMKDNDLLSVGKLIEVGRADLVARYVGWTAKTVQSKFIEAKGSVLFIDEAYSLLDDREGLFGDEAINTIVQEMENRRDDVVVIFAGYTDKMETFLQRNPGLRSRIAFHVPFADYNPEELIQILELIAENKSMHIDKNVKEKLLPILEAEKKQLDFGNGRFMRNLFEKACMKQAGRLLLKDVDNLSKKELTTLTADDFEAPMKHREPVSKIGFA